MKINTTLGKKKLLESDFVFSLNNIFTYKFADFGQSMMFQCITKVHVEQKWPKKKSIVDFKKILQ